MVEGGVFNIGWFDARSKDDAGVGEGAEDGIERHRNPFRDHGTELAFLFLIVCLGPRVGAGGTVALAGACRSRGRGLSGRRRGLSGRRRGVGGRFGGGARTGILAGVGAAAGDGVVVKQLLLFLGEAAAFAAFGVEEVEQGAGGGDAEQDPLEAVGEMVARFQLGQGDGGEGAGLV